MFECVFQTRIVHSVAATHEAHDFAVVFGQCFGTDKAGFVGFDGDVGFDGEGCFCFTGG